jgi:predicted permease
MNGIAYQQFSTIIPFLFVLFLGFLCGKSKLIENSSVKTFGHIVFNYLTPFMVINFLQKQKAVRNGSELMWAILSAIIIFGLYFLVSFIFFLRKKRDTSAVYACALCSTAVSVLAYPILANIPGVNAGLYSAMFLFVNHLLFNILSGKTLFKKRALIKSIITLPFLIEIVGLIMYFLKLGLILPLANTVSYISDVVPILSAFMMGMYFSSFPASGFKFQFDVLLVSVFKLLLFPILTFGICLIADFSLETTLMYVALAGLPCGLELSCITSFTQNQNIARASNITACSFALSLVSIPMLTYTVCEIYTMLH